MLPWRYRYDTEYVEVDRCGRLCLEDLKFKLELYKGKVGLSIAIKTLQKLGMEILKSMKENWLDMHWIEWKRFPI